MRSKGWFALISFFISASIFLEILGRDAVRQIDVIIKAVLDRRTGGELRFRPDPQNGRGKHVRSRMADAFEIRHLLRAVLMFFVRRSSKAVEINHEAHEGHEQFDRAIRVTVCHTIVTWQLLRLSL